MRLWLHEFEFERGRTHWTSAELDDRRAFDLLRGQRMDKWVPETGLRKYPEIHRLLHGKNQVDAPDLRKHHRKWILDRCDCLGCFSIHARLHCAILERFVAKDSKRASLYDCLAPY